MTRRPPGRALWELTRRCDLRCAHCLVSGGPAAPAELDRGEALDLVDQLAELGVRVVTISGGEPLLRPDWLDVARRVRQHGIVLRLSTNGHAVDDAVLRELVAIGTQRVVVSVDGTRETHDRVRRGPSGRTPSSFDRVMACLDRLRDSSVGASVITAVTRPNLTELPAIHALLKEHGVERWTVQLAHATGRAADEVGRPLMLAPEQLEELMVFLVRAVEDPVLPPLVFNSIGYLSEEEPRVRPSGRERSTPFWHGCQCGITSLGIEPDGGIKGCANQIGGDFVVGSIRDEPLQTIWDDRARWHWLEPDPAKMRGACAGCALAKICGGGCSALAHAASGSIFDNPYCLRAVRRRRGGLPT